MASISLSRTSLCVVAALSLGGVAHAQSYTDGAATSAAGRSGARHESASGPFGVWRTKTDSALVRVEPCGSAICGYSVDQSGRKGQRVLIDLRPAGGNHWTGIVADVRSGARYDSKVSLSGPDQLLVEGCVLGGIFCGGETWTRVSVLAQSN